eukprot:scaffold22607_cov123-Cylindrotheca_fusiformis.AAC.25
MERIESPTDDTSSIAPSEADLYFDERDDEGVKIINQSNSNLPDVMESTHIDSLIAQQMSKLSTDEREKAYFDIHGIANAIEETPELVQTRMQALDDEIGLLKETAAYQLAMTQNPAFVQDAAFRLKFLRADKFDAKKAALRLARHFDVKLDLFGPSKLVQDIQQADLEEGDIDALLVFIGHLPIRDSVGRLVRVTMAQKDDAHMKSEEAVMRALFYSLMVLSDDEETQKKGAVLVSWAVGFRQPPRVKMGPRFKSAVWAMVKLAMTAVPMRHEAIHLCYDNLLLAPVLALVKVSLGMYLGVRVRTHYGKEKKALEPNYSLLLSRAGNEAECQRKLQTFGIPTSAMPLNPSDMAALEQVWTKRKNYEMDPGFKTTKNSILVPGHLDVLLGRGRRCQEHIGNMRLRNLVEDCKPVYDNVSRKEKTLISQEIVETIKKNSDHFLKDEDVGWVEVDDQIARLKVSHTFRDVSKDANKTKAGGVAAKRERDA